jgi:hypothetical protein
MTYETPGSISCHPFGQDRSWIPGGRLIIVDELEQRIEAEGRQRSAFFPHRLLCIGGVLVAFAAVATYGHPLGIGLFVTAAAVWTASALFAVRAGRHMFGTMKGSAWGASYLAPAQPGKRGATVAAAIMIAFAICFACFGVWVLYIR